ncbi:MAG: glucose/quinate/shikimate family membrane-bound PQQ-dependent dehydrogenase [Paracoccus sp. (in: a-proteobacteria)]|uniref:glucose/quinate/shikimate family membrane-bound PQQ-dependent dehydrogenase n=1 Tax=Paracoccus sp. TaxID=267 RepID=UPI0032424D2D
MMISFMSCILGLLGLALALGGTKLAMLGGSLYYIIVGVALLVTALLMFRRKAASLWLYAAIVIGTLAWAVWEVGFDWWQLAPRGGILVLIALILCLPVFRRSLGDRSEVGAPRAASVLPVALASVVSILVAGYSLFQEPSRITGELPTEKLTTEANTGNAMEDGEWHQYGRTNYGQRWSPLEQITPANVADLELAWEYQTGDVKRPDDVGETTYQVTPLKVGDSLYVCTPHNIAISIDAKTGKENWRFDANSGMNPDRQHQTCRGVTYWQAPEVTAAASTNDQPDAAQVETADEPAVQPADDQPADDTALRAAAAAECPRRVYLPTADARLIALNADTGEVCSFFGEEGTLPLERGMEYNPAGYYYSTSPPVAVDGKLIIGGAVNDNFSTKSQSGVIRAFDIDTGELLWNWDSGNPEDTTPIDIEGGERYTTNSPNSWSVFSADAELGLVYIPTGNQVPDQLGMNRTPEVEARSSAIVALDIATGQEQWIRQTVHHDLWDMDVPAQPVLIDLTRDGQTVPALVGPTKQGDIWILDRRTGEPLSPRDELPAAPSKIPGEETSPTQPISALTFRPDRLTGANMWGGTMIDQMMCRIQFQSLDYEGQYTPPSLNGTLVYPGNFGTFNWGSVAVDPERQVMFGMPTYLPFTARLVPASEIPPKGEDEKASEQGLNRNEGADYGVFMGPFLSPLGVPCTAPPWGFVAGADLNTESVVWKHKNGTIRDMTPLPLKIKLGVPGIGGPMITRGGVVFLGAAVDDYLRAYDLTTGDQLWETRLPAGGQSTPMTYEQDGEQYVVIVAGGHGSVGTKPGDYILSYKLP